MVRDQTIVCLATLSWDYLWQRHQELMARLARAGNRVLFVEPIGIRMPNWQDRQRLLARVRNRRRAGARGVRQPMPNVWILDPLVNPFQQVGAIHRRNVAALTNQLKDALAAVGGGTPIVWDYAPTPLALETIARLPRRLLVYDCMDALTENPKGVFPQVAEAEKELSRAADLVFVSAPALLERQKPLNPHTYLVPNGVQYEKFAGDAAPEPGALANVPHPRLLFFGGIDERVDVPLLTALAKAHPHWQLVLLGIVRTDIAALRRQSNVHFLGHIAHDALPAYLRHSDVLLLPYRRIGFSRYMYPAKLHECLAAAKPTVALWLPVMDEFRDVLRVADTPDEFEAAIVEALGEPPNSPMVERRRACARANTWEIRFECINAKLEERLADAAARSPAPRRGMG